MSTGIKVMLDSIIRAPKVKLPFGMNQKTAGVEAHAYTPRQVKVTSKSKGDMNRFPEGEFGYRA